jgi:hypothetical protein
MIQQHGRDKRTFSPAGSGYGTAKLDPSDAIEALRSLRALRVPPNRQLIFERDMTMLLLVAFVDLPSSYLVELRWRDLADDACRGLRLHINGLEIHVPLGDQLRQLLESWRARLALSLGRQPHETEPVFPLVRSFLQPGQRLATLSPGTVDNSVAGLLASVGVPFTQARMRSFRGALVGVHEELVFDEEAHGATPPDRRWRRGAR